VTAFGEPLAPSTPPEEPRFGPRAIPDAVRRNLPALLLVGFAITYPEFLTGSTPVLTIFLSPLALPFLLGLYGAGVLLIREASVRWGRGWPTILLLGGAYGILEEGIGTKTFFDASLVGAAGSYGHALGVNWLWVGQLILFHAIYSIALPILTVDLLFPSTRGRSFVSSRGLRYLLAAYGLTVGLMFFLFNRDYPLSPLIVVTTLAGAAGLILAGRLTPVRFRWIESDAVRAPKLRHPILLGAAFVWGFFLLNWGGPALRAPVALLLAAIVGFTFAMGAYVVPRLEGPGRELDRVDFLVGALSFLVVLGAAIGVFGDFLVLPVIAVLVWILFRLRIRWASSPGAATWTALPGSG